MSSNSINNIISYVVNNLITRKLKDVLIKTTHPLIQTIQVNEDPELVDLQRVFETNLVAQPKVKIESLSRGIYWDPFAITARNKGFRDSKKPDLFSICEKLILVTNHSLKWKDPQVDPIALLLLSINICTYMTCVVC